MNYTRNIMTIYLKHTSLILLFCLTTRLAEAQDAAPPAPEPPPVAARAVPEAQWREATQGLDYSDDQERPRKPRRPRTGSPGDSGRDWTLNTGGLGSVLQVLAIILAVAGIAFGVYKMLMQPRNRVIARDGVEITLDNLEEYLHETDLDRFLRAALHEHNFALAIRLYYLQIIKDLSARNAIRWSREKTNRDYLREMRPHRLAEPFRTATRTFEQVWYGNLALDEAAFRRMEPEFKNLLGNI